MLLKYYYWLALRLGVIFLSFSYWIDLEIIFIFINFLFLHINIGLKSMLIDYIHIKKLSIFLISLLRVILIINLLYTIELFF